MTGWLIGWLYLHSLRLHHLLHEMRVTEYSHIKLLWGLNKLCGTLSRFSRVPLSETSWTVTHQAALSMGFPRQEYWSGMLFPSPGDLPDPGIEPRSPSLQADSLLSKHEGGLLTAMKTQCCRWWGSVIEVWFSQSRSHGHYTLFYYPVNTSIFIK